jgi:hypothetical protein
MKAKLAYAPWLRKHFTNMGGWYYSNHERIELGFAMQDLSKWGSADLKEEYQAYIRGTSDRQEAYME